jgi:hypothetical protein
MPKKELSDQAVLEQVLKLAQSDAWAIGELVLDRFGEDDTLPEAWAEPLVKACLADTNTREQRLQFMWLLARLPEKAIHATISVNLYVNTDLVRDAVQEGDEYALAEHLDELLPGYSSIPAVRHAVGRELIEAVDRNRRNNDD